MFPLPTNRPPPSRRGFTLLELLVAMSLMVVVASCLYTALYTGFRAYREAQAAVDPTAVASNVIELLKRDLCGVLPPGSHLAGAFIGTDSGGLQGVDLDSLEFYTTHVYLNDTQPQETAVSAASLDLTTLTQPVGGIGKVTLLLEEDTETKDGTYLLLREVTTNLLAPNELDASEQVLCRDVVSLNLRYFDGTGWVDSWDSTEDSNSLPLAVEVDLEVSHKDRHGLELQQRRLKQSFPIPCQAAAAEDTATDTSDSGSNQSENSSGQTGGSGNNMSGGSSTPQTGGNR